MTKVIEKYTAAELEEAKYEIWLMEGGPARAEAIGEKEADRAIKELEDDGYRVLERRLVKPSFEDVRKVEVTVRKGDEVVILRHNRGYNDRTPNGYWHEKYGHGGWGSWSKDPLYRALAYI